MSDIRRVGVVGAGTMGHGIAHVCALAGFETRVIDARADALDAAMEKVRRNLEGGVQRGKLSQEQADDAVKRLSTTRRLEDAVEGADLVIEAIVEDLEVKRELFRQLDALVSEQCILATNTSALSVSTIAEASAHPARVLGMHFFNPVHIMKLIELVVADRTAESTLATARVAATKMGKEPIVVRDTPGFASSRLGVVLGLEAMRMVEQGVASPEDIDKAMELGYGHPMGPLKVSDLVGLDVRMAIAQHLHRELEDPHYAPPSVLARKVAAGELGKKTGKGFYEWPNKAS